MSPEPFVVTADPDLDAVTATLVEAFRDDPVLRWTMPPDTPERDRWLDGFLRSTTALLLAHDGRVAHTQEHEAVAVWSPPGQPDLDEAGNAAWLAELAHVTGPCAERAVTLVTALDEHHPTDLPPHVHVMFAAARPEAAGRGVLMLRALTRRLGDPAVGLYAEASSPVNLGLWQAMGLQRTGPEIPLPGGPSLYPIHAPGSDRAGRAPSVLRAE